MTETTKGMDAARRPVLMGVIGASAGCRKNHEDAYAVGRLAARRGWIVVTGGLAGVMHEASRGAVEAGGLTVGILPSADRRHMSPYVTIPIVTAMGHARNVIIAHTSDALIAVGGEYGTLSEIAVSLKLGKTVVGIDPFVEVPGMVRARSAEEAVELIASSMLRPSD